MPTDCRELSQFYQLKRHKLWKDIHRICRFIYIYPVQIYGKANVIQVVCDWAFVCALYLQYLTLSPRESQLLPSSHFHPVIMYIVCLILFPSQIFCLITSYISLSHLLDHVCSVEMFWCSVGKFCRFKPVWLCCKLLCIIHFTQHCASALRTSFLFLLDFYFNWIFAVFITYLRIRLHVPGLGFDFAPSDLCVRSCMVSLCWGGCG